VLADCGVRYGTDVLKFLALGVKAVGLGRSFMYANIYGTPGVEKAIEILKKEIFLDAVNLGINDIQSLNSSCVSHPRPSPLSCRRRRSGEPMLILEQLALDYVRSHLWDMGP
jgi:isopentenyl diphosphate isomerase/L-lactate dehydrogenase-like FMN-dependent dehydrogenase